MAGIDVGIHTHVDHVQAVGLKGRAKSGFELPEGVNLGADCTEALGQAREVSLGQVDAFPCVLLLPLLDTDHTEGGVVEDDDDGG